MSNPITERPIIFNAQEVNAVLAGNKSQHRVVIENTIETQILFKGAWRYDGRDFLDNDDCIPHPKGAHYMERLDLSEDEEHQYTEDYRCVGHCPLGVIGDRLWVQELHARTENKVLFTAPHYYAEGPLTLDLRHDAGLLTKYSADDMPRWASRILLEITDISIERIQDISESDALASGLIVQTCQQGSQWFLNPVSNMPGNVFHRDEWIGGFASYWNSLNGKLSFDENPWVWVIEFKVIEPSED